MGSNQRTYGAAEWRAAAAAWEAGDYGTEWLPYRDLARQHGMLYPPTEAQRTVLWDAINEDPDLLRFSVTVATSWSGVLDRYLDERRAAREAADAAEAAYRQQKASYVTQQEAAKSLADIMQMLADSVGTQPPASVAIGSAVSAYQEKLHRAWWDWHNTHHTSESSSAVNGDGLCLYDACRMMRHITEAPIDEG